MKNNVLKSVRNKGSILALALAASGAVMTAQAAADPSLLGSKLTKIGGDPSANSDGSIPAWTPPGPQGGSWEYGQVRGEHWIHKDDKPLYTITASNMDKYADKLSAGHKALFKQIPDYQMDIYPTRRSCDVPDFVAENTRKNVGFAQLDDAGLALKQAYVPGIPFPMPETGAQAMWNMKMRYRGVGFEMSRNYGGISPRKGGDDWIKTRADTMVFFPWGIKGTHKFTDYDRLEAAGFFSYAEPAALAGQAAVLTTKAGQESETFYYFPGQRRVRRMPSYSYDAPQIGLDNQYNVDELGMFAGPLDRFDWKLVGKQEKLVPYNSFGLYDFKASFDDVAKRNFLAPEYRRYELHRVWVVEATVRDGMRHSAPKREFYLDEDSWAPLVAVDYDGQGTIAKVREGFLTPVYETGGCDVEAFVQHNLIDGRYMFDYNSFSTGKDHRWITEPGDNPRLRASFYTPDSLRMMSDR